MTRHKEARQKLVFRYFDGEVSPGEAKMAERFLEEEPDLAQELYAVKNLGALLREDTERAVARVDFSFLADRVLAEAENQKSLSLWERLEEFFRARLGRASQFWLPGAVVAAAALAGLLMSQPHKPEGPRNETVITKVETDNTWISQTIDDQGTTILWVDDTPEE